MNRLIYIPLAMGILAIAAFLFVSKTISSVILFIPGVIVTFIVYLNTYYRRRPEPDRVLPLYMFAMGIQLLHFTEEYLTDFTVALPALIGESPYPADDWLIFNMVAYFFFILGGIILYYQNRELSIIPLFFILIGVVLNSIGHLAISIYTGGYFPGLYTSLIYVFIGPVLIKRIFEERTSK